MAWCQTGYKSPTHRITLGKTVKLGHWKSFFRTLQKKPHCSLSSIIKFWALALLARPKKEAIMMVNRNYSLQ